MYTVCVCSGVTMPSLLDPLQGSGEVPSPTSSLKGRLVVKSQVSRGKETEQAAEDSDNGEESST